MNPGGGWPYDPDDYEDLGDDPIDNPVHDPHEAETAKQMLVVLGIAAVTIAVILVVCWLVGVSG